MQPQKRLKKWSCFFLALLLFGVEPSRSEEMFRTPARLYSGAYSIKVQLKKDLIDYDIPVWIKPDQAESTLDPVLMTELGLSSKVLRFDEVKIGGHPISKKKFSPLKSEWAFVPDFSKSCCHGVIGRDILQNYLIRFDPANPTHLEWTALDSAPKNPVISSGFQKELESLFSLTRISEFPFVLNLKEGKVIPEGTPSGTKPLLFTFDFVPPDRNLKVLNVQSDLVPSAAKIGLRKGEVITWVNGEKVSSLDRWQLVQYLSGRKADQLEFTTLKKRKFSFDFKSNQFLEQN